MKKNLLYTVCLLACMMPFTLRGQEKPRTIDFTQKLVDLDGKPIPSSSDPKSVPLTLGDIAETALNTMTQADQSMTGTQKGDIYALMIKIHRKKQVVLTAEEIALLKERVGKGTYFPIVVGQALRMLDPATAEAKTDVSGK